VIERFHYLKLGLSVVLTFVGVKMLITYFHIEVPIGASLGIVAGVLATSVVASVVFPQTAKASAPADGPET
jgi:tellurite resistance protein TerC